jgi:hypothetical protein
MKDQSEGPSATTMLNCGRVAPAADVPSHNREEGVTPPRVPYCDLSSDEFPLIKCPKCGSLVHLTAEINAYVEWHLSPLTGVKCERSWTSWR